MYSKIFLALFFTLICFNFCEFVDWNAEIRENIAALGIPQTVPNVLERFYVKWSQEDACLPEMLKSFEVPVIQSRHPLYDFRIQIVRNSAFFKAELWMEFYGMKYEVFEKKRRKRKYVIDIEQGDSRMKVTSLKCSDNVTKGNPVEISCDMTAFYSFLKELDEKFIDFSIYLHRRKGREVSKQFRGATVKVFVVLYEKNKDCTKLPTDRRLHGKQSYVHPQKQSEFLNYLEVTNNRTGLSWRVKREASPKIEKDTCSLKDWNPSFEDIGFTNMIIAPSSAAISKCTGKCTSWKQHLTTHAVIKKVFSIFGMGPKTCCVPAEYGSMTLVQYDAAENMIVVVQYSDMIAKSCACY